MKTRMTVLVCAAQLIAAAQPAAAAELHSDPSRAHAQTGSFAGARIRVPLGGGRERPQAGLALTAVQRSGENGALRFARGAELGLSQGEKVSLKLGGRPVAQLARGGSGPDGRKIGASTTEGLLIVGGIVVLAFGGLALLLMSQE